MDTGLLSVDADRISQLPEDVAHYILSFLSTRDLVRVGFLSKVWYGFFSSFPISNFYLQSSFLSAEKTLQFVKFVHSSLHRQALHHKCIPKFKLSLFTFCSGIYIYPEYRQLTDLINRSVLLSRQFGVQEISLYFHLPGAFSASPFMYKLSEAIFNTKEFPLSNTNWLSLKVFSLEGVDISDQRIIENLVFTCPFIEKFSLKRCSGLKPIRLLSFTKLKEVKFVNNFRDAVRKVEIDALSLRTFTFSYSDGHCPEIVHIDLTSCKNLEVLKFSGAFITNSIIHDINSKFPALKLLVLYGNAHDIPRIELCCPCLEELHLCTDHTEAIIIDAPRLQSFNYALEGEIPYFLSLDQTSLKEVSLELPIEDIYSENGYDFLKSLMKYLENFNQISHVTWRISTFDWIHQIDSNISIPALRHIKHLKLRTELSAADPAREDENQALIDVLFSFCHPESLLLECGRGSSNEFIKILCKNLMYSCLATNGKSWPHDLKGIIKIELIEGNGDTKTFSCDAWLDSLPTLAPDDRIRFVFKW